MIDLNSTFWLIAWGVMTLAFVCAWVFIVVGCHKIDSNSEDHS